jgi:hypothetical protein
VTTTIDVESDTALAVEPHVVVVALATNNIVVVVAVVVNLVTDVAIVYIYTVM